MDELVLGNRSRESYLKKAIKNGNCLVALNGDLISGFIIVAASFFGHPFIELLIVDPEHRRKRIASQLMKSVELTHVGEKLFTSTNQSNITMQRLCESLGYQRSGYIENLDDGDPEIIFYKDLRKIGVVESRRDKS